MQRSRRQIAEFVFFICLLPAMGDDWKISPRRDMPDFLGEERREVKAVALAHGAMKLSEVMRRDRADRARRSGQACGPDRFTNLYRHCFDEAVILTAALPPSDWQAQSFY
jgi:hypothetical protein